MRAAREVGRGVQGDALEELGVFAGDFLDRVDVLEEDGRRGLEGFSFTSPKTSLVYGWGRGGGGQKRERNEPAGQRLCGKYCLLETGKTAR